MVRREQLDGGQKTACWLSEESCLLVVRRTACLWSEENSLLVVRKRHAGGQKSGVLMMVRKLLAGGKKCGLLVVRRRACWWLEVRLAEVQKSGCSVLIQEHGVPF